MTKDEAMKLALEALEYIDREDNDRDFLFPFQCAMLDKAITAIKQALAEPVQEPVQPVKPSLWEQYHAAQPAPAQSCYCPNCEAMGKELAALKAQPAPVQEPVGYADSRDLEKDGNWDTLIVKHASEMREGLRFNVPLYTTTPAAQRQWVGLTEDEQDELVYGIYDLRTRMELAIGIESKLKEKNT